jgi:hypothetical protein
MPKNQDHEALKDGVAQGFVSWMEGNPLGADNMIEAGFVMAVRGWLDANRDDVIAAIARRLTDER